MDVKVGLYEQVISELLRKNLFRLEERDLQSEEEPLDEGESHVVLAQYVEKILSSALASVRGEGRLKRQIEICNELVDRLSQEDHDLVETKIDDGARRLLSIVKRNPESRKVPVRPETPLASACILTGTCQDPTLVSQLKKEIIGADRIDILCSFIKWSGIRILEKELREFTERENSRLRIITTSYMGATDIKAVDFLRELPHTELRVSYDTRRTRLHAKAYIFHRDTGFGTAYVGSANLSHAALTEGLEWNVKISQYESLHLWQKMMATFDTYWNDSEFVRYEGDADRRRLRRAIDRERHLGEDYGTAVYFDLHPYAFQQTILDRLEAERKLQNRHRHLVVAATGTGKTMIAAFDYLNWSRELEAGRHDRPRLLFVAHREEILRQSLQTFRQVLRDQNFGDLLVGGHEAGLMDHLFVSIQSYNSRELWGYPEDYFDYVVVDEFHHAAAKSYERLLSHVKPRELMGLTATPERMDGLDVVSYFGGHISAEIRLPDAINRKLLSPFQYFAVSDSEDLSGLQWTRGGYRIGDLDKIYTGNEIRARLVADKVREILLDVGQCRGLGFCVSIGHAEYMAERFRSYGISAEALSAESSPEQRRTVQRRLVDRKINFIFVVDLYNEGVDIPEVDTVLFLRPTESLTVFLQQLGRGLRLHDDKECLTVLDFVGRANRNFRYDLRYRALLSDPSRPLEEQVEEGFPYLSAGCTINMERKARERVLENIRGAINHSKRSLIRELARYARMVGGKPSISDFLNYTRLNLDDIYRRGSWLRLCVCAGAGEDFSEPDEAEITRGLRRIQHIDSARWINTLLNFLNDPKGDIDEDLFDSATYRRLLMFHISLWGGKWRPNSIGESLRRLLANPTLCAEIRELLEYRLETIDSVSPDLSLPFECPLSLHSLYSRDEILAGLGYWTMDDRPDMREGVLHLKDIKADAFFVTLNKTERDYSPTTMYHDYAINGELFHWQSQSRTSVTSPTAQRYFHHAERGHTILLFVREDKRANGMACPYYFLGPATYVQHEGNKPIDIVWRLCHPLPAKLLRRTARLAAG